MNLGRVSRQPGTSFDFRPEAVRWIDAVPASIIVYLLLLFVIPARFVVPGFGAAGAPASLLGAAMLGLIVAGFFHVRPVGPPSTPVLWALLSYAAVIVAGYANARLRPATPLASTTSDRAMITMASLFGVAIFTMVHVRTVAAVHKTIDIALALSAIMCGVGLAQFFLSVDLTRIVPFPGLVANSQGIQEIDQRSIFNRPFGTTLHPIEFGVVTGAMVPLAVARAVQSRRRWHWIMVVLLAFSALLSISRSAVLVLAVVFLVMLFGFSWRGRFNLTVGTLVLVIAAGSVVPGLVGTLRSLFTGAANDPSITARLDRTPEVLRLISEFPWFGRGFGVFTPEDFLLLDNEIQRLTIEIGVIGVGVLAGLALTVTWCAVHIGRVRPELKVLSYGLLATVLGIFISWYTFDSFFYHILTGMLFLSIGLISTLYRCSGESEIGAARDISVSRRKSERELVAAGLPTPAAAGWIASGRVAEADDDRPVVRTGLSLLVANDGGHLMQLHTLAQRLNLGEVMWATVPTPQSESLLEGHDVVWTGSAETRDWKAVLRNHRHLRVVLKNRRPARVISTGSSLALSVLPQAARMGMEAHYIESVTRTEGFSLSGRILAKRRRVKVYTQWEHLATERWRYGGSVLDGFEVVERADLPIKKVVVSLGTQGFGFRRLVERLVKITPDDVDVLWQTGPTDVTGLGIDSRESVPSKEMASAIEAADVLISHAGAGISLSGLQAGKLPLIVPRRAEFGEHIDDHQEQIARSLERRGLAIVAEAGAVSWLDVQRAAQFRAVRADEVAPFELR